MIFSELQQIKLCPAATQRINKLEMHLCDRIFQIVETSIVSYPELQYSTRKKVCKCAHEHNTIARYSLNSRIRLRAASKGRKKNPSKLSNVPGRDYAYLGRPSGRARDRYPLPITHEFVQTSESAKYTGGLPGKDTVGRAGGAGV